VVALGIAGDADAVELRARLAHRLEEIGGALELAGLGGVAGRHEQLADARRAQPGEHLLEMAAVANEPRRQMGHDRVACGRQPLAQLERGLEPLPRGRGDGDLGVGAEVLDDLLVDAVEREQLEAGVAKQVRNRRPAPAGGLCRTVSGLRARLHPDISGYQWRKIRSTRDGHRTIDFLAGSGHHGHAARCRARVRGPA